MHNDETSISIVNRFDKRLYGRKSVSAEGLWKSPLLASSPKRGNHNSLQRIEILHKSSPTPRPADPTNGNRCRQAAEVSPSDLLLSNAVLPARRAWTSRS